MRYDVILWDVDDTLLDFPYSQKISLIKAAEKIGVTVTEEMNARYAAINDGWWKRLEKGEVTKPQLLTGRFLDWFADCGIVCENVDAFRDDYERGLGQIYRYRDDSLQICKALQGKCRQFAVTNGVTASQLSKLKLAGFFDIMENIFISEQLGAPKPQRLFFDRVLETMPEVARNRILIVGDSLSSDMRGGNNAGIATCWYNPTDQMNTTEVETDFIIRNLKEVIAIVEG